MAAWKVAPALAAGNSVILKPAEQSSLSAIRLAALVEQAGIAAGAFQVLPGAGPVAGRALGLHPDVDCVAFTGSTATGKRFMTYSGESNLKRVWLECGGKSPHIVFEDCPDLDRAALIAALAIFSNQGEVCIAGSRLYVQDGIYDAFMDKVARHAAAMAPGNPLDPATALGAMVDERQTRSVMARIAAGQPRARGCASAAARCARTAAAGTSSPPSSTAPAPGRADARGDLRPGAGRPALRHRGRGHRAGQ